MWYNIYKQKIVYDGKNDEIGAFIFPFLSTLIAQ